MGLSWQWYNFEGINVLKGFKRMNQIRYKYDDRRLNGIDFNSMYQAYLRELKEQGISLYSLAVAVGLHHHSFNQLEQGRFSKPMRFEHILKASILTGIPFDLSKYQHLAGSKEAIIRQLEGVEPTKKHNKNK